MPLTIRPFAHLKKLDSLGRDSITNVASPERIVSIAGGAALALYGASRRSWPGLVVALLGGAFIYRGTRGHCDLYDRLGINTATPHAERGVPDHHGVKVEHSTYVEKSPEEVFTFWRRLENLPLFMPHLESVEEKSDRLSHWVVKGPANRRVEWDAEIINEHHGRLISWQSLPGSTVQSAGSVRFEPEGSGTRVLVNLKYNPLAGKFGALVARLFGKSPKFQIEQDLARFKDIIESK